MTDFRLSTDEGSNNDAKILQFPSKSDILDNNNFAIEREFIFPIFISDIYRCKLLYDMFGTRGIQKHLEKYVLMNNFPIRKVKVTGTVVGVFQRCVLPGSNDDNYAIFEIDDFSGGSNSIISVRSVISNIKLGDLLLDDCYGLIIEAIGYIIEMNSKRQIQSESVRILSAKEDIRTEIKCWAEKIEARKCLSSHRLTPSELLKFIDSPQPGKFLYPALKSKDKVIQKLSEEETDRAAPSWDESEVEILDYVPIFSVPEPLADLEVLHINDKSISAGSDRIMLCYNQLMDAFLNWMLNRRSLSFKLISLYQDNKINEMLRFTATLQIRSCSLDTSDLESKIRITMKEIFHTIRHTLQIENKLIRVTKNLNVKPAMLYKLSDHLLQCLSEIKLHSSKTGDNLKLNIPNYNNALRESAEFPFGRINNRSINTIIEWILTVEFKDRISWKYDSKSYEWLYIQKRSDNSAIRSSP